MLVSGNINAQNKPVVIRNKSSLQQMHLHSIEC